MSGQNQPNYGTQPAREVPPYDAETLTGLRADAQTVIARYPQARSALLPLLHLVQSVDGYVTTRGIRFCAETLELTEAEVSGVATFYTQYKRHPAGRYNVGVCTNTLCAVMGGDQIWDTLTEHLGIDHDETTPDGAITLERLECNAGCDYAPVVMANWEFFDNMTPESTIALVDAMRAGEDVRPSRGPDRLRTFQETERVLAGFNDGLAAEGVGAGVASLRGVTLAKERGWTAPDFDAVAGADKSPTSDADAGAGAAPAPGEAQSSADRPASHGADDKNAASDASDNQPAKGTGDAGGSGGSGGTNGPVSGSDGTNGKAQR